MARAASVARIPGRWADPSAIVLDAEFRDLLPALAPEEQAQMEFAQHKDGCLNPLVAWRCQGRLILLVGYELFPTLRLYRIPFRVEEKEFASRDQARMFMILEQLGRRNLIPLAVSYLRGLRYAGDKQPQGGDHKSARARGGFATLKTAQALAEVFCVSPGHDPP